MISQKEHVSTLQGCPTRQSKKASSTDWSLWSRWDLETAVGSRSHCGARPPYHYEQEHSMNIRNFANLTMWGLVALSLVVSTVGTVAELEPLEQNCLLQTKESKEQQLVVQEQTQGAWTTPPGIWRCPLLWRGLPMQLVPVSNWKIVKTGAQARQDLTRAQFPPALVSYLWHVNVAILQLSPANVMRNQVVEQPPSGYVFKCGPFCRCADFFGSEWGLSIDDCAAKCADEWGFIFAPFGPPGGSTDCRCCRDLEEVGSISPCDYSMVFVCILCGRHPRWPTHQYFWCPTLHSSQPGHLFTVALLRGGHWPFRRDCRNQEASRRIGKSMPTIQVASPSQRIQRACFSSTTRQNPCGKCSRSLHRTASGRHGKETKSGGSWTR